MCSSAAALNQQEDDIPTKLAMLVNDKLEAPQSHMKSVQFWLKRHLSMWMKCEIVVFVVEWFKVTLVKDVRGVPPEELA